MKRRCRPSGNVIIFVALTWLAACSDHKTGVEDLTPLPLPEATLTKLASNFGTLSPAFSSSKKLYELEVPFWIDHISLTLNAAEGVSAKIGDNAAALGEGVQVKLEQDTTTLAITVQASDHNDATYKLTIYRGYPGKREHYIKASNTLADNLFGYAIALDGDTLVVGAQFENSSSRGINDTQQNAGRANSGAVYVFVRNNAGDWSQQAFIKASNADVGDLFGKTIALDGNTLVVGAVEEDSANASDPTNNTLSNSGAVYVYIRIGSAWTLQQMIKAPTPHANDSFGSSLAIDGDTLVVGAPDEDNSAKGVDATTDNANASDSGAAYVFARSSGIWSKQAYIKASNTTSADHFGTSVALQNDTLIIGAPNEDGASQGVDGDDNVKGITNSGAAYVFTRANAQWTQSAYLKSSNTDLGDFFAWSLALDGDRLAVGAPFEDSTTRDDPNNNDMTDSGAVYVFSRQNNVWQYDAYLKADVTDMQDIWGISLALQNDTLVVGAREEGGNGKGINTGDPTNDQTWSSGAVYVLVREDTLWTQHAYIKAFNNNFYRRFGACVDLDGNTLAVGAYGDASNAKGVDGDGADQSAFQSGAAHIFR